jgi:hypothetical protein
MARPKSKAEKMFCNRESQIRSEKTKFRDQNSRLEHHIQNALNSIHKIADNVRQEEEILKVI